MSYLELILEKVAKLQKKFLVPIFIFVIVFTIFVGLGISKINLQTDLNKEMPQDIPIYKLNDKIRDKFGGQDTILVIFTLDETLDFKNTPKDIRNPIIMQYLILFENELKKESIIDDVFSVATFLKNKHLYSLENVRKIINDDSRLQTYFSKDYKTTLMYISSDVGNSETKIIELTNLINNKIEGLSTPPGVKIMLTGNPYMRITIFNLLANDVVNTLILASLIILLLLFIMERSFTKGLLVFIPLMFGLTWTIGTMGWLGIKLSIATVGLGAMILGLGVEYGVFILTRYKEERDIGKNQIESLKIAVPSVGSAILGSGLTTIVGFLALTLSILPMMQHLGISLALGIIFCLIAAVFVFPIIILLEENFEYWYMHHKHKKQIIKKKNYRRLAK